MKKLGDRLRDLREMRDLKQTEVAARLGISNKILSSYERNISMPTIENLKMLCEFYNVSADHLLQIELRKTKTETVESPELVALTPEQKHILSCYERLDPENREAVLGLMILYYKEQVHKSEQEKNKEV